MPHTNPYAKTSTADFQIRLKPAQLDSLVWTHCDTSADSEHNITRERGVELGGITEWSASWQGRTLTLGWDWILCGDGVLQASAEIAPRTNILILDLKGYDPDPRANEASLWIVVNSIPWKAKVSEELKINFRP